MTSIPEKLSYVIIVSDSQIAIRTILGATKGSNISANIVVDIVGLLQHLGILSLSTVIGMLIVANAIAKRAQLCTAQSVFTYQ